jgi:hypothetical protein
MNIIDNILLEISARTDDGIVDFKRLDNIIILREILQEKGLPRNEIKKIENKIVEMSFPKTFVYDQDGYAIVIENAHERIQGLREGIYLRENPNPEEINPQEQTSDDPNTDQVPPPIKDPTQFTYKNDNTVDKGKIQPDTDAEQANSDAPQQQEPTPAPAPQQSTHNTPTPEGQPQPSLADWKHSPEKTREKAESLGWEQDELGYWWHSGKLQAITTKKGYIMPILDGNKGHPTDWPEAEVKSTEQSQQQVQQAPKPQEKQQVQPQS